ncbi:hypothetical protein GGE08_001875 [Muricauda sp. ARW1Y1]|jgi:hypothetical protein|nr:hypothetical protein [Muricauda sp. ARW1Y1]
MDYENELGPDTPKVYTSVMGQRDKTNPETKNNGYPITIVTTSIKWDSLAFYETGYQTPSAMSQKQDKNTM